MRVAVALAVLSLSGGSAGLASAEGAWPLSSRLPFGPVVGAAAVPAGSRVAPAGAAGAEGGETPDGFVVAIVGGEKLTYGLIRKQVGGKLTQARSKYLRARRETESKTLEKLINGRILRAEAARRGLDEKALLEAEIEKNVPQPSDDELKAAYEKVKERVSAPFEDLKSQLARWLSSRKRQEVRAAFFADLRKKAGVQELLPVLELPVVEIPEGSKAGKGPKDAPIKVVVFSDFECPFCSRVVPAMHALYKKYKGKIRLAFRDFPLDMHENARRAAEAGGCASDQQKFWQYHDLLFDNQSKLTEKDLIAHARALNLDMTKFEACLRDGKYKDEVQKDLEAGMALGVNGTPALFINGTLLSGAQPLEAMVEIVESFLKGRGNK